MSMEHHGDSMRGNPDLIRLFKEQQRGESVRKWPGGRMGANDDGQLAYAIATDTSRGVILLDFGKEVSWLGLDIASATQLRDQLTERVMELRGITAG